MAVTLLEYAQIANQVYNTKDAFLLAGWECQRFKMDKSVFRGGSLTSDGFQGGSFYKRSSNDLVIGFKGTVPSMAMDLLADLKIVLQQIPTQTDTAMRYLDEWAALAPNANLSLVGHSLGGGLCQVVGSWRNTRFVTFNAPAMGTNWLMAHCNIAAPFTMVRTILAHRRNDGVNYRLLNDPVSKVGNHIGRVVKIEGGFGVLKAHSMDNVVEVVARSPLANTSPFTA